jgi:predicted lipoprotein with Yx(FWY)xxD motif
MRAPPGTGRKIIVIGGQRVMTSKGVRMRATLGAVAASILVLASCSSGDSKPAAVTGTNAPTTSSTIPPPIVVTKVDPKLGEILADNAGLTLYTLTNNNIPVACDPTCAAIWPPVDVPPGGYLPTGGVGVGQLGVAPGPNDTLIVTSHALPLYRFTKDKTPADALGEGVKSFGGTWNVVKVGTGVSTLAPSSTTTSTTKATQTTEPDTTPETTPETTPATTPDTSIEPTETTLPGE